MLIRQMLLSLTSLTLALGLTACGGMHQPVMMQQMALNQMPAYNAQQPASNGGGYAYEAPPETGYNYDSGDGVTLPGTQASPDPNAFNNGLNSGFMGGNTGYGNPSYGTGLGTNSGYRDPYGNNYGNNNNFGMGYGNSYGSGYNNNMGYNSGYNNAYGNSYGNSFGAYSTGTQRAQF